LAEKQSLKACKKSAKAAKAAELKEAFTIHAEESANQVERLTRVFEIISRPARAKTCEATKGILAEMDEDLGDFGETDAADDVLIGCAQALEHYEIARYGMLAAWGKRLGLTEAVDLLTQTLEEEKAADEKLSAIAEGFSPGDDGESAPPPVRANTSKMADAKARAPARPVFG
jgi:ferritin-like metal-binding protein YciE